MWVLFALGAISCSPTSQARRAVVEELRQEASPEAVRRVETLLRDPDPDVRAAAIHALASVRTRSAAGAARLGLRDRDGLVRATAATSLGVLGDEMSGRELKRLLIHDRDWRVRVRCAEVLGTLRGAPVPDSFEAALTDPVRQVRLAAARVVGERGWLPLLDRVSLVVLHDDAWSVRVEAARTLGRLGSIGGRAALEAALADPNEFVRAAASYALAGLPEARVEPVAPARRRPGPVASPVPPTDAAPAPAAPVDSQDPEDSEDPEEPP